MARTQAPQGPGFWSILFTAVPLWNWLINSPRSTLPHLLVIQTRPCQHSSCISRHHVKLVTMTRGWEEPQPSTSQASAEPQHRQSPAVDHAVPDVRGAHAHPLLPETFPFPFVSSVPSNSPMGSTENFNKGLPFSRCSFVICE